MTFTTPPSLQPLLAAPVAIFGGGVSGVGVLALLANLGASGVIYDEKATTFSSKAARAHRLVVFSPGFAPEHPWFGIARDAGCECQGELDFAAQFWRGNIVAVTGTNGKTTLTEFLTHALRSIGREAYATGNVGHSFSQLVAETAGGNEASIAICEVSSFQAETLRTFRADATLWTNFAEDHLERHRSLESYFGAKWNLLAHTANRRSSATASSTSPVVFVGASVHSYAVRFDRPLAAESCVETEGQSPDKRLTGTVFSDYPQRENFLIAAAWWKAAGLAEDALLAAAKTFVLGRHRLARVAAIDGVTYWNDSKATNFHAVEAALTRFASPVILIAGGKAKGGDLAGFVHRIASAVKHAVLIGETSAELAFHCSAFRIEHTICVTLAEAVRRAADLAKGGDNILLSPGFASFDMFRGYADRGEQFEQLVRDLNPAASFG
jgi:UDP-N-acetylmuramoylalanine--D-glutamate ligase